MFDRLELTGYQRCASLPLVLCWRKAPTGVPRLDEMTGGGLPLGRTTLVAGSAESGMTLLGLQFLVAGARDYGEPGVLITFEESAAKVSANVASLGLTSTRCSASTCLSLTRFGSIRLRSVRRGSL